VTWLLAKGLTFCPVPPWFPGKFYVPNGCRFFSNRACSAISRKVASSMVLLCKVDVLPGPASLFHPAARPGLWLLLQHRFQLNVQKAIYETSLSQTQTLRCFSGPAHNGHSLRICSTRLLFGLSFWVRAARQAVSRGGGSGLSGGKLQALSSASLFLQQAEH